MKLIFISFFKNDIMIVVKKMNKKVYLQNNFTRFIDWVIRMIGYAAILIFTSFVFKNTLYIDNSYYWFWALVASILIYLLNKTVKPILVKLTIPITGITLGLFYPFINLIILKIVTLILDPHFHIYGIWFAVCASILISILNVLMDTLVFNKLKAKEK